MALGTHSSGCQHAAPLGGVWPEVPSSGLVERCWSESQTWLCTAPPRCWPGAAEWPYPGWSGRERDLIIVPLVQLPDLPSSSPHSKKNSSEPLRGWRASFSNVPFPGWRLSSYFQWVLMAVSLKVLFKRKLSSWSWHPCQLLSVWHSSSGRGWQQSGHKICGFRLPPVIFSFFFKP